jgi:hypothetical protein
MSLDQINLNSSGIERGLIENVVNGSEAGHNLLLCNVQWKQSSAICNISNPTMKTGLDFKSAQFDQVRGEAEKWIKMRGLEI